MPSITRVVSLALALMAVACFPTDRSNRNESSRDRPGSGEAGGYSLGLHFEAMEGLTIDPLPTAPHVGIAWLDITSDTSHLAQTSGVFIDALPAQDRVSVRFPPDGLVFSDPAQPEDGAIAMAQIVLLDDVDGNGAFDLTHEVEPPDRLIGGSQATLLYVKRLPAPKSVTYQSFYNPERLAEGFLLADGIFSGDAPPTILADTTPAIVQLWDGAR